MSFNKRKTKKRIAGLVAALSGVFTFGCAPSLINSTKSSDLNLVPANPLENPVIVSSPLESQLEVKEGEYFNYKFRVENASSVEAFKPTWMMMKDKGFKEGITREVSFVGKVPQVKDSKIEKVIFRAYDANHSSMVTQPISILIKDSDAEMAGNMAKTNSLRFQKGFATYNLDEEEISVPSDNKIVSELPSKVKSRNNSQPVSEVSKVSNKVDSLSRYGDFVEGELIPETDKPLSQQIKYIGFSKPTDDFNQIVNYGLGVSLETLANEDNLRYFADVECGDNLHLEGKVEGDKYSLIIPNKCADSKKVLHYFTGVRTGDGSKDNEFSTRLASFGENRQVIYPIKNNKENESVVKDNKNVGFPKDGTSAVSDGKYPCEVTLGVKEEEISYEASDESPKESSSSVEGTTPTEIGYVSEFDSEGVFGGKLRVGVGTGLELYDLNNGNLAKDGFVNVSVDYPVSERIRFGAFGQYNGNTFGVNNVYTNTELTVRERKAIGNPVAELYRERVDSETNSEKTVYPWEAGANLSLRIAKGLEARFGAGLAQRVNYLNQSGRSDVSIYRGNELLESEAASNVLPQEVSKSSVFSGTMDLEYQIPKAGGFSVSGGTKYRDSKWIPRFGVNFRKTF